MEMEKDKQEKLLIKDVFLQGKYNIFKEFCRRKDIVYLQSINGKLIGEFSKLKGVGEIRLRQVVGKLVGLDIDLDWSENNIFFNINKLKAREEDKLRLLEINSVFSQAEFKLLREYCLDRGISTLYDMDNRDIYEFREVKGVGRKRYGDFIGRLKEITKTKEVKDIEEIGQIALDRLDAEESLTIIARLIEDLSLEETAEILEISPREARKIENKALENIENTLNTYNGIRSLKVRTRSLKKFFLKDINNENDGSLLITSLIEKDKFKGLSYIKSRDTVYFDIMIEETA